MSDHKLVKLQAGVLETLGLRQPVPIVGLWIKLRKLFF